MRRINFLIDAARRLSENEGVVTDDAGISDEEFIQYMNDAQDHIFERMEHDQRDLLTEEYLITSVANQEAYNLPPRIYLDGNIVAVEYADTGNGQDYYPLTYVSIKERDTSTYTRLPSKYLIRNGQILINPIPSGGSSNAIRIQYVPQVPKVDKRRAQLDSVTVSSGEVTALSVDITDFTNYFPDASAFSSNNILVDDYFCVVGADGTIKARNIPITAISSSTGNATITSYTPESTSETAAVGDYLVAGANSSTHSELPDACERFLIHYCALQIMLRDGTVDVTTQADLLQRMEKTILTSWINQNDDVLYIPIIDDEPFII